MSLVSRVIQEGENIASIAIREYKSIEGIYKFWQENPAVNILSEDLITLSQLLVEPGINTTPIPTPAREFDKDTRYEVVVQEGQNIVDIVVQEYGSVEAIWDFVTSNGLNLLTVVVPGQVLKLDSKQVVGKAVNRYYKERGIKVATGVSYLPDEGGPYWIDEDGNYIVDENGAFIRHEI